MRSFCLNIDFDLKLMKKTLHRRSYPILVIASLWLCQSPLPAVEVTVTAPDSPMLRFALGKLEATLKQRGDTLKRVPHDSTHAKLEIDVLASSEGTGSLGPEGFSLARRSDEVRISSSDERGAMYGVLEVAEQVRLGTPWNKIQDRTVKAQFEFRAIKFNLPWAAYRTSLAIEQH